MFKPWGVLDDETLEAAALLRGRLGDPRLGVILGSGWGTLAEALGAGEPVPREAIPGFPVSRVDGHGGGVAAASGGVWVFKGRVHRYEGRSGAEVVFPVRVLAAAGARGVLLTCAAGGLLEADRPGDFAVVHDHLNLQGTDPVAEIEAFRRDPAFPDLQGLYDPEWSAALREALGARPGVLAAMRGPCYETPAEVRMLRALGADLASMSTVPEAIAARYLGIRVAAVACISNRGSGMDAQAIRHGEVLGAVERAARARSGVLGGAVAALAGR